MVIRESVKNELVVSVRRDSGRGHEQVPNYAVTAPEAIRRQQHLHVTAGCKKVCVLYERCAPHSGDSFPNAVTRCGAWTAARLATQ